MATTRSDHGIVPRNSFGGPSVCALSRYLEGRDLLTFLSITPHTDEPFRKFGESNQTISDHNDTKCTDNIICDGPDGFCPSQLTPVTELAIDFSFIIPYFTWAGRFYLLLGIDDGDKLRQFGGKKSLESAFELYNRQTYGLISGEATVKPTAIFATKNKQVTLFLMYSQFPENIIGRFRHKHDKAKKFPERFKDIAIVDYALLLDRTNRDLEGIRLSSELINIIHYLPSKL